LSRQKKAEAKAILFSKAAGRGLLSAVSHGASETAIKVIAEEKTDESYWQEEEGKRKSLEEFRQRLAEFAKNQPLVIVIDELDRAKPDYALSVLETIKHFFNVPHVKFILGVNLPALGKMVEHRYGLEPADALKYLERFIHLAASLPNIVQIGQQSHTTASLYGMQIARQRILNPELSMILKAHLKAISKNNSLSLRDTQRIISKFILIIGAAGADEFSKLPIALILIILTLIGAEAISPLIYKKFLTLSIARPEMRAIGSNYELDILSYFGNPAAYNFLTSNYQQSLHTSHFDRQPLKSIFTIFQNLDVLNSPKQYFKNINEKDEESLTTYLCVDSIYVWEQIRAYEAETTDKKTNREFFLHQLQVRTPNPFEPIPQQIAEQYLDLFNLNLDLKQTEPS